MAFKNKDWFERKRCRQRFWALEEDLGRLGGEGETYPDCNGVKNKMRQRSPSTKYMKSAGPVVLSWLGFLRFRKRFITNTININRRRSYARSSFQRKFVFERSTSMNLGRSRGTLCYTLDLTRSNCCAKLLIKKRRVSFCRT